MGGQSGNTAKGAMIGQSIDPLFGSVVGGLAGKHKGSKHGGGAAQPVQGVYNPHVAQNWTPPPAAPANPYGNAMSPWSPGAGIPGKGTPPQAQGPMTPAPQLGGGGPISRNQGAPMKGR